MTGLNDLNSQQRIRGARTPIILRARSYAFSGVGLLIAGLIMLRGVFGRATAYAGVAAGVLGILGLISIPAPSLIVVCILDLVLWGIWAMLLGRDLIMLGR